MNNCILLVSTAKAGWKKAHHINNLTHAEAVKLSRKLHNKDKRTRCKIIDLVGERVAPGKIRSYCHKLAEMIPTR